LISIRSDPAFVRIAILQYALNLCVPKTLSELMT
jgi:hypothetical protein